MFAAFVVAQGSHRCGVAPQHLFAIGRLCGEKGGCGFVTPGIVAQRLAGQSLGPGRIGGQRGHRGGGEHTRVISGGALQHPRCLPRRYQRRRHEQRTERGRQRVATQPAAGAFESARQLRQRATARTHALQIRGKIGSGPIAAIRLARERSQADDVEGMRQVGGVLRRRGGVTGQDRAV